MPRLYVWFAQRNNPRGFAKPDPVEGHGDEVGGLGALVEHLGATVDALYALEPGVSEGEPRDRVIDPQVHPRLRQVRRS